MSQPLEFKDRDKPDHACKLVKLIYGLHQSLWAWLHRLRDYPIQLEFKEGVSNQSLFVFIKNEVTTYF